MSNLQDRLLDVITENRELTQDDLVEAKNYGKTLTPEIAVSFYQDCIAAIVVAGTKDRLSWALEQHGTADYDAYFIEAAYVSLNDMRETSRVSSKDKYGLTCFARNETRIIHGKPRNIISTVSAFAMKTGLIFTCTEMPNNKSVKVKRIH